ncbi:MAG: hypothetical protein M4579_000102 [Chaenotheca gracillima]|nr:MAG: hypothetical protein M4579_000102 [Chaenotheca gracillima]
MVSRKPVPSGPSTLPVPSHPQTSQDNQLPYPTTPTSPPETATHGLSGKLQKDQNNTPETSSSEDEWNSDGEEEKHPRHSIPRSLQFGKAPSDGVGEEHDVQVPPSLRPSVPDMSQSSTTYPPTNLSSTPSQAIPQQQKPSTNPYIRRAQAGGDQHVSGMPSSSSFNSAQSSTVASLYADSSDPAHAMKGALPTSSQASPAPQDSRTSLGVGIFDTPSIGPHELNKDDLDTSKQSVMAPTESLSNMNLGRQSSSIFGPSNTSELDSGQDTTSNETRRRNRTISSGFDPQMDISTLDAATSHGHGLADGSGNEPLPNRTWDEQKAWEHSERERREQEAGQALERAKREELERHAEDEWFRGEEARRKDSQTVGVVGMGDSTRAEDNAVPPRAGQPSLLDDEPPLPPLPARPAADEEELPGPPKPPRPQVPVASEESYASRARGDSLQTAMRKQTSETYQIKHINWVDGQAGSFVRRSPILVQNANGPCPLLALVNALTLTTPPNETTALVETLRVREQVSLGLLLDAVFDELVSGRRGDAAQALPDVSELYQFLITLHTGMNVNPSFVSPTSQPPNLIDAPIDQPTTGIGEQLGLGGFERTREMRLYSTFAVPLIHGWLPPTNDPTYAALDRSAKTYEDAQNLLFREEELETKLSQEGLTPDEQQLLQDVVTIKYFLNQAATQLTPNGLESIGQSLKPGSIAILFRNDHFSTLYKHPFSHQLLQLVTDAGYSGHDEIVWESLVDVNGERCEFYAGDFRPVGNGGIEPQQGRSHVQEPFDDGAGWTAVERNRSGRSQQPQQHDGPTQGRAGLGHIDTSFANLGNSSQDAGGLGSPNAEQEDHDMALALQLQEEEEDRHRRELAARRREENLSQQFLSQQSNQDQGPVPQNRRQNRGRGNNGNARGSSMIAQGRNRQSSQNQPLPPPSSGPGGQNIRPLIPPRRSQEPQRPPRPAPVNDPEAGIDVPPPTYEQAASDDPYYPPPEHPAHPSSSPAPPAAAAPDVRPGLGPGARENSSRSSSATTAYSQNAANMHVQPTPQHLQMGPGGRRVYSVRDQARGLLNEVQGPSSASVGAPGGVGGVSGGQFASPGPRRRQSAGSAPLQARMAAAGHGPSEDRRDKDCVIM